MPLYRIINGKRYEANLLNKVESRTQGRRNSRISKAEAQELWSLAMEGGRMTELEEETLLYAMSEYRFSEIAKAWLSRILKQEIEQSIAFYKTIDGRKYDRAILDKARELTEGRGDGRISLENAQTLWSMFGDTSEMRIEEERTLEYLINHYSWTNEAVAWLMPQAAGISQEYEIFGLIPQIIQTESELPGLLFEFDRAELRHQMFALPHRVSFPDALRKVLKSFLQDEEEGTLRHYLLSSLEVDPEEEDFPSILSHHLKKWLGNAKLLLLKDESDFPEAERTQKAPSTGESFTENWIFGLQKEGTEDFFWGIVPRDGAGTAYNHREAATN